MTRGTPRITPMLKVEINASKVLHIMANHPGCTTHQIVQHMAPDANDHQTRTALEHLEKLGRVFSTGLQKKRRWHLGAAPSNNNLAAPRTATSTIRQPYKPKQWTNEIARPGGEAHKRHGSLQPDGSVKPYRAPIHGCTGELKDKHSHTN